MTQTNLPTFAAPGLVERIKRMLGVDFYRLFHTPMFYIFLAIAAIIPAMTLSMGGMSANGEVANAPMYENAWNIVAADDVVYVASDVAQYANMNMVFIFGGIMVSIFIGHDYTSGYVKQLFTTHSHKSDYMISKTITCAFAMACMCLTYLLGGMAGGVFAGLSFRVNFLRLLVAILSKMILSLGWASLYTCLNVVLRRYFGVSVCLCFVLGTGIPIIGAAAVLGSGSVLNIFLYGASVSACLSSNFATLIVCALVSAGWAFVYNAIGTLALNRSDVY